MRQVDLGMREGGEVGIDRLEFKDSEQRFKCVNFI